MKRNRRTILLAVPALAVLAGVTIAGVYGWNYAKQTVLLGREKVPVYQPIAQLSSQVGSDANSAHSPSSTEAGSQPGSASSSQPISQSGISTDRSPATQNPKLWNPVPRDGVKIGSLSFPSIHLSVPVVQGSDESDLSLGVGHDTATALPGQGSNVFLAGHRDTVFSKLRYLKKGDDIVLSTPYGDFVYQITGFQVVPETDVALLAPTDYETLTLSTCYPFNYFGSAPDRYIVFTKVIKEPKSVLPSGG